MSTILPGNGRGILAITTFVPLRKPGQSASQTASSLGRQSNKGSRASERALSQNAGPRITRSIEGLAKYNYKANPNSPLGSPELSLKQCEKLLIHDPHPVHSEHWVFVSTEDGCQGYVPLQYVHIQEKTLPWLANKRLMEEKKETSEPVRPVVKPYRSAYAREQEKENFRCKVCSKSFNGPVPYQMHLASKAHREEEEYQNSLDML